MKTFICLLCTWMALSPYPIMSQQPEPTAQKWLKGAPPIPEFTAPVSKEEWQTERASIRAQLWQLLGKMPDHTEVPKVTVTSREDHGDCILEKFHFENGA